MCQGLPCTARNSTIIVLSTTSVAVPWCTVCFLNLQFALKSTATFFKHFFFGTFLKVKLLK